MFWALCFFLPKLFFLYQKYKVKKQTAEENAMKGKLTSTKHSAYNIAFNIYEAIWQSSLGLITDADRACKELYKCNHSDMNLLREMYNQVLNENKGRFLSYFQSNGLDSDFQRYCKKSSLYEKYNLKYFFT